ncbi:MAG TPA: methylamine methyltransferase corrinoid protein reductive activase [Methanomassiliicoccales archaeon]|nr:methylamine methyltransferase corrinoid protein reductive activase [Methanomassiliicoccales archaeon]
MAEKYGISIDVGTSGTRAHAIDLKTKKIISTAITVRHPIPGMNVMDHLTFCIEVDRNVANALMIDATNRLLKLLDINLKHVERMAICGNPIQLSIFQNMEIRDLAFAMPNALRVRGVEQQKRDAKVVKAVSLGLDVNPEADLYVPPAIKHEIGADALAMMLKTGLLDRKETCLVTDYGTNAEMALKVGDEIYTGSAAAGPAIEGQHIKSGMLASPGAISDMDYEFNWRMKVLDDNLLPVDGDLVDLTNGDVREEGPMHGKALGVTGTGVIAAIAAGLDTNLVKPPKILTPDHKLHLMNGITLDEHDFQEAAKTFGAMRAGHFTLLEHAGVKFEELDSMYMSGASGTYVDALKAQRVGLIPPTFNTIYQVGNTSLAMATDIVRDPEVMDKLQSIASAIRANHVMFATDKVFETIFIQELAFWQEGMPLDGYNMMLKMEGIQELPKKLKKAKVEKLVQRDIPVLGDKGLKILRDIGVKVEGEFEGCIGCEKCKEACPERALAIESTPRGYHICVASDLCGGTACMRCEMSCPEKVFKFRGLTIGAMKRAKA